MEASTIKTNWDTELASLLNDLSQLQDEMLEVLNQKRQFMAENDLEAMAEIQPREEEICSRLEACLQRRGELLNAAANEGLPSDSILELASALPIEDSGSLGKRVKNTSSRMRLLQHHCLTNWVIAQRTLLHLSQMLEIIATGGRIQPTYGEGESVHSRGALVDREA